MYALKKCKNVRHGVFTRIAGTFYVRHCVIYVIQSYILGSKLGFREVTIWKMKRLRSLIFVNGGKC